MTMPKKKAKKKTLRAEIKKRAKAKSAADQEARHTAAIIDLKPLAKEINARLEKAGTLDGKADDHRLTAAITLERARIRCDKAKLNFKKWIDEHVTQSYGEVFRLVAIGASQDPAKALQDLRSGAAKRMKKLRAQQATSRDATAKATPLSNYEGTEQGLEMLPDKHVVILIESQAAKLGLRVVSIADSDKIRQVKRDRPSEFATIEEVQTAFRTLKASDKMALVKWGAALIGMTVSGDFQDGDAGDVPKSLRRKARKKSDEAGAPA